MRGAEARGIGVNINVFRSVTRLMQVNKQLVANGESIQGLPSACLPEEIDVRSQGPRIVIHHAYEKSAALSCLVIQEYALSIVAYP